MTPITQNCRFSGQDFVVSDEDQAMLHKLSPVIRDVKYPLPIPTLSPYERRRNRLAHINQMHLFLRKCDATGEQIISNYRANSEYTIFSQKQWYSDAHDGREYGQDIDWGRPFFEQFYELALRAPRPALMTGFSRDENSDYTNYAGMNKDCYLVFDSDENWGCLYSYGMNGSKDSLDCLRAQNLELCLEAVDSKNCYNCAHIEKSENCSDSYFLYDCVGVKNSLFCTGLRQKENCLFNKPASQAELQALRIQMKSYSSLQALKARFQKLLDETPRKYRHGFQNENVVGDYLVNCKDCYFCFDSMNLRDGRYCTQSFMNNKDYMDVDEGGDSELLYNCSNIGYQAYGCISCLNCLFSPTRLLYSDYCFLGTKDCFGCTGLKRKQYCILNKQYTKEEYESLVPRLIEHMKKHGEWGEFFPIQYSPFGYNETWASIYFPLTQDEVQARGWKWQEESTGHDYEGPQLELPDSIDEATDDFCGKILRCEAGGKLYKIIPQELAAYRRFGLPLPRRSFMQRHQDRVSRRNPRALWKRSCSECDTELYSSYSPERSEQVLCEACYLKTIY